MFEVVWTLSQQSALLEQVDHVSQATFVGEEHSVDLEIFSRDSYQRVTDPAFCQRRNSDGRSYTDSPVPAVMSATLLRRLSSSWNKPKESFRPGVTGGSAMIARLSW